jgi:choline transport protein
MLTSFEVLAPHKPFLSYLVGWCVLVGEISTSASCALNSAEIVAALVEILHADLEWKVCASFSRLHRIKAN